MKYRILIVLSVIIASTLQAQDVVQLVPEKFNDYALNYYLPTTVVEVEFVATQTTDKAGPYYQYAQKYLGTSDAITEDRQRCTLDYATMITRGIANTENRYQLTFKAGQTPYIFVNQEGCILSINTAPDSLINDEFPPVEKDQISDVDTHKALTEEMLMSGSIAKMAELAAKQIYRIRESRMNLLTGEADNMPSDGESLKIIIEQLDKQEAALTALFLGTTSTKHITKRIKYMPQDDVKNGILMRFSDVYGFVDADNLCGAPIYLSVEVVEKGEYPVDEKGVIKKVPKGAVAYCIPGKANIKLQYEKKTLCEEAISVAQLGVVFGISPSLLTSKKEPTFVIFNPDTGGISEIGTISAE